MYRKSCLQYLLGGVKNSVKNFKSDLGAERFAVMEEASGAYLLVSENINMCAILGVNSSIGLEQRYLKSSF